MNKWMEYLNESGIRVPDADYSQPQVLKSMVNENYSKISKKMKTVRHNNEAFYELLDFDKPRVKRRVAATIASCGTLREKISAICPDIPNVFYLEQDWAIANSTPITSIEIQEKRLYFSTGAAIWILDQIKAAGRIEEAAAMLPDDEETLDLVRTPDLWDPCHGTELLFSVLAVIQQRNADCTATDQKRKKGKQNGSFRVFADRFTTAGTHRQDVPSRKRFEMLLSMIPEKAKRAAVHHYEKKFWEWVGCYYRCRAIYAAREHKLSRSCERFCSRASQFIQEQKTAFERSKTAPAVLKKEHIPLDLPSMLPELMSKGSFHRNSVPPPRSVPSDIFSLGDEMVRLDTQSDNLCDEISDFIFDSVSNTASHPSYLKEQYGDEIASILGSFSIDDPYELCFAALYLLDQGSDLPWLYFANSNLMENVGRCLPWANGSYRPDEDVIWNPNAEGELRRGPRRGRMPDQMDWYRLDYFDKQDAPEDGKRTNLAQIVYDLTGGLMPRDSHRYDGALGELACFGITGYKALPLLNSMLLMGEARRRSEIYVNGYPEEPEPEKREEPQDTVEQLHEALAALRQENNRLKQENGKLKRALHSAARETEDEKEKYTALTEQTQLDRRELAELREIVFYQQNEIEVTPDAGIEYPYTVQRRTVVFGGHDSWARAIKPMLKGDIRFIDRNMLPNADLIRHADMIWLQTNSLSHKFYNKIMDVVRTYGISLHYFKFASAEKCAEQVALHDLE